MLDGRGRWPNHLGMEVFQVLPVAGVFVFAGGVKGVTGMGLPTVAMSLLGLWMAPAQAAALLVAPSLATNIAQCRGSHMRKLTTSLWPAWLALAAVTVMTPDVDEATSAINPQVLLGLVLLVYGGWGLCRPALPVLSPHASMLSAGIGAATGVVTAMTAVFVIPFVPYLQALRLDKDEMVQALGISFTVATLALAVRLQASGGAALVSSQSVAALLAAFAGLWLGTLVRARITGRTFQRSLFVVFMALGAANLMRGH